MDETTPVTDDEIARTLGYARVKDNAERARRGGREKAPRRRLPRLGARMPQAAFA